jgi:thiamine biosynthesis lipoprotein
MKALLCTWVAAAGGMFGSASAGGLERYDATEPHMGVSFTIVLYAADPETANRGFERAFARIEQLNGILSDYSSDSESLRLSAASPMDNGMPVSQDLWYLLHCAQALSRQSGGAFDVTVGPLTKLWRRAHRRRELPPSDRLEKARAAVGYRHVDLDDRQKTVRLTRPEMRLDFGGIAKGYAADQALKVLREMGMPRALVNASGDISAGDPPPEAKGWKIGVAPLEPGGPPSRFLRLANSGIATSGDAFQYVEIAGRRYSHIVDPRTGLGLTIRSSVTVIAPDGTTADSLASAISVLGPAAGLGLLEKTRGATALIVIEEDGKFRTVASPGFAKYEEDAAPGSAGK